LQLIVPQAGISRSARGFGIARGQSHLDTNRTGRSLRLIFLPAMRSPQQSSVHSLTYAYRQRCRTNTLFAAGTFPGTYLANRIGARLCSVASVHRADLAVWLSPATRVIKHRAVQKGFGLSDYSKALRGYHPGENLARIALRPTMRASGPRTLCWRRRRLSIADQRSEIATRTFRNAARMACCKPCMPIRRGHGSLS
jgi:hypothetical protein